jgi:Ribonuclease G/E
MGSKMLIDAAHPEETRVVVVRGNRIEEFDYESSHRKQLKGNIYLAKVTRVEPSLQAAFVDYGGNRHGFLAFSEIHPDYYQIPVADRQALLREEEDDARRSEEEFDLASTSGRSDGRRRKRAGGFAETTRQATMATMAPSRSARPRTPTASSRRPMPKSSKRLRLWRRGLRERLGRAGRGRGRAGGGSRAPAPAAPGLQDPGSHQAAPDHAGAGGQGGARQQGRGAHDLSVAGRALRRADAEHRARRRHIAQDHRHGRPQAPEGSWCARSRCPKAWG